MNDAHTRTDTAGIRTIGIVGSLHGSEPLGSEAIALLPESISGFALRFVVGNPAALAKGVRYLKADLNRSFPGKREGDGEERRAAEILDELRGCDIVIDIHSTTAAMPPVVIAVENTPLVRSIIDSTPIQRVIHMRGGIDARGSLIFHKPGISLEYPHTARPAEVAACITMLLRNLASGKRIAHEEFETIGILRGDALFENFAETGVAGERFVPIFSGEEAYDGTSCIKCKRMARE